MLLLFTRNIDESKPYTLFDPVDTWKKKTVTDYTAKEILKPIFKNGECVYESRPIKEIRYYCAEQVDELWEEVLRFENPHKYYVDLSEKLWNVKHQLLEDYSK